MNQKRDHIFQLKISAFMVSMALVVGMLIFAPAALAYDAEELQFLTLINNYRTSNGLPALTLSYSLSSASAGHSCDMANQNYFSHNSLDGRTPWDRIRAAGYTYNTWLGENIAAGQTDAVTVFNAWRNSPSHNANMLSSNYLAIGIDRCYNAGSQYGWYWTTDFGGVAEYSYQIIGNIDSLGLASPGRYRLSGWAIDTDTTQSINVHIYVDGTFVAQVPAADARADVGAAYPAYGADHGYSSEIGLDPGSHTVCVYGINIGPGSNMLLGCRVVDVSVNPFGDLNSLSLVGPNQINVDGWAIDPDTANPIDVHFYVDGQYKANVNANVNRPDVGVIYPFYNGEHGYSTNVSDVAPGEHTVCAFGINTGAGDTNPLLGCKVIDVPVNPFGNLDGVAAGAPGQINVDGWAIDPDTTEPVQVHIYVNGRWGGMLTANDPRADVDNIFPDYAPDHGFSGTIPVNAASNTVCAYAINAGAGDTNSLLGCKVVNVAVNPLGNLEGVSAGAPGEIDLSGWAIDPGTANPIQIHVYVNGRWSGAFTADGSRPDVGGAFPGYGDNHGFSGSVAVQARVNTVCAYGINAGAGDTNPLLGCKVIDVPVNPFGNLDGVSAGAPGQINVDGWAIDPDTTEPVQIHIYVNGRWGGILTATDPRADVDNIFPDYAPDHGFSGTVAAAISDSYTVCVYGINVGAGDSNPLLGCRQV